MKYFKCSLVAALLIAFFSFHKSPFFPRRIQVPLLAEQDLPNSTAIVWPKKFRFLGRGHQIFAFESEDEQFVLKFFDRQKLEEPGWLHRRARKRGRRLQERIQIYPESYRLAFERLRRETALLIVHQGISSIQYPRIELIDSDSRVYQIDLNKIPFILQKKVKSSLPALLEKAKKEGGLTHLIDQFLDIHRQRISIQIADYDRNIRDNYGWDGKRLIYLDPARLYVNKSLLDPTFCRAEWMRVTEPVRKWLKRNAPQEVLLFDVKVEQFLDWQTLKFYKGKNHACRSHCWDFENCHYSFNHSGL